MSFRLALLLFTLAFAARLAADQVLPERDASAPRQVIPFDAAWRFVQGDPKNAADPALDISSWRTVDVPHDWAIAGPFSKDAPARGEGGYLPTGVAWYRQSFSVPESQRGRRLFVEFDGVMANSGVYLNGQLLGRRPNGYVGLRYELTPHLKFGADQPNTLAVRTDTSKQVASRWYTGSGIYRHVRLVLAEPLHIAPHGVFVTTPEITANRARIETRVAINNTHDASRDYLVSIAYRDPTGQPVAMAETTGKVAAQSTGDCTVKAEITAPQLWDFATPQLYTAEVMVKADERIVDRTTVSFGIRRAEFRAATGFWLNGRNHKLRGVCLHHDGGAVGAAVPKSLWEERLAKLKELGVNAIRTAHNPPAPEFLDLCDRLGLVVMDEFFDCWTVAKRRQDYHQHFREWWRRDLEESLRRDSNHPSVVLYSVGNEIHDTHDAGRSQRILKDIVATCHAIDPTRPVTQALFRPNVTHDYDNGLSDLLDVIGTNYRDAELLQAWRDQPTRRIIGTEQPHERSNWLLCRDNPPHAGQFLWVGVDYLGESAGWPTTTFDSGLLDRSGELHPRGAERQSWWSDRPVVHIYRREAPTEASPTDPGYEEVEWRRREVLFPDWTPRNAAPHEENIEVYSNCAEVELFVGGVSQGVKSRPADARARNWRVAYEPGEVLAIGRDDSQDDGVKETARCQLQTAGPAAAVRLSSSRPRLQATWDEVAVVRAEVVDAAGVRVPRAAEEVTFTITGPGEIVAVDNGSIVDHDSFQSNRRRTHRGRCTAIIRATAEVGKIRVTASAEELAAGVVEIEVVE